MGNDGMSTLTAFVLGRQMAGNAGDQALAGAERDVAASKLSAVVAAAKDAKQEAKNWRQYAARLRVNLDARKMSEATLLAELKESNVSHPMATEEGFEAVFDKALAAQYGEFNDDSKSIAFDDQEAERMQQSVEQGREAVK